MSSVFTPGVPKQQKCPPAPKKAKKAPVRVGSIPARKLFADEIPPDRSFTIGASAIFPAPIIAPGIGDPTAEIANLQQRTRGATSLDAISSIYPPSPAKPTPAKRSLEFLQESYPAKK